MTLKEWNEYIILAETSKTRIEKILGENGTVNFYSYNMYDGTRGIQFIIKDIRGEIFKVYYSGVFEDKLDCMRKLKYLENTIEMES